MDIKNIIFIIVGALVVVLAAGGVGYAIFFDVKSTATQTGATQVSTPVVTETKNDGTSSGGSTPSTSTTPGSTGGSTNSTKGVHYRDGTYTKEVTYDSPLDPINAIEVTATIKDNKIISLKTISHFSDDESQKYIDEFNKVVSKDARGKDISTYQPARLGGASLTTKAFVEALAEIKAAA